MQRLDETQALWNDYKRTGDKALRDRLILTYAPLVKYVAGRLGSGLPAHVEDDDLVSYGLLGLIGAIERYVDAGPICAGTSPDDVSDPVACVKTVTTVPTKKPVPT